MMIPMLDLRSAHLLEGHLLVVPDWLHAVVGDVREEDVEEAAAQCKQTCYEALFLKMMDNISRTEFKSLIQVPIIIIIRIRITQS